MIVIISLSENAISSQGVCKGVFPIACCEDSNNTYAKVGIMLYCFEVDGRGKLNTTDFTL